MSDGNGFQIVDAPVPFDKKRSRWHEILKAVKSLPQGKAIFIPFGTDAEGTIRQGLYYSAKKIGVRVSVQRGAGGFYVFSKAKATA